jgi:hypothetical protein
MSDTARPVARPQRWRSVLRLHGPIALLYLIITLLFTYPTVLHLRSAIGGQLDALENYWNYWWTDQAVLHLGVNPFAASYMHHPFGLSLYFHTFNVLNGLLSLPIQACCGTAAGYNALNVFAFTVAALGMYALVCRLTQQRAAAFTAGLIYAFSPYMAFHLYMGQTNLLSLEWLPWYVLALLAGLEAQDRRRWLWLPLASAALLLNALTDWHYVVFAVVITAVVGLYEAVRLRRPRAILALGGKLALVGGLFALLASPLLLPMISELRADPSATRPLEDSITHSTDLLAFLLPSPFHPLWGAWASRIFFGHLVLPYIVGGIGSVGLVALVLALVGGLRERRYGLLFLLLALVSAALALGPYLQVNGVNSANTARPIPLPYLFFRELPFMNVLRIPSRFVAVTMLSLAVLAGLGIASLRQRSRFFQRSARARQAFGGLTALLVLFEFWPLPFRMTPITPDQVSPFFQQLGADPAAYAIAEVPYRTPRSMFYQTYHHKLTIGGRIARPKLHPWFDARFFGPLIQTQPPQPDVGLDESVAAWRSALACQQVRYVVFYKQDLDAKQQAGSAELEAALFEGVAPAYEDAILRAYGPLERTSSEPYWTLDGRDWDQTETNPAGVSYRWLRADQGRLLIYPCGANDVTLRFNAFGYAQPRTLEVAVDGELAQTVQLPQETLTAVELPLTLHAGENQITLRSVEPPISPAQRGAANDDRLLSINLSGVSIAPR